MEAALAQHLGAVFLQYVTGNPQFQHDAGSPLFALLGSLSRGHGTSVSIEGSDHATDHQANASKTYPVSEIPRVVHVPRLAPEHTFLDILHLQKETFSQRSIYVDQGLVSSLATYLCRRQYRQCA